MGAAISYTGFALEFAGEGCAGAVPVYFVNNEKGGLGDLFFLEKDLICEIRLLRAPLSDPHPGRPHCLENLITALYLNHKPATPLTDFLTDIRERIPLNPGYQKRRPDFKGLLKPEFAEAGFELIGLHQYGRTFTAELGWVFPQDRDNPRSRLCLYAGAFECTPAPERTLGKGRWMMPMDVIVGYLFSRQLKKMQRGNPVNLLTDEGKEVALETFKWTKVSLLMPKELKKERVEFVRQHSELHQSLRELAKAMKAAGLYSDTVEIYVIAKQLPRLIAAATTRP